MSLDHAIHNREVCNLIHQSGGFNDWVVTTAFYSALHFVHHKIFPLTINNITYKNFNEYFSQEIKHKNIQKSKHDATIDLVHQELPNLVYPYQWLYTECYTVRYRNYTTSAAISEQARKHLQVIEKVCKKK